ncbi:hypothetical protein VNO80_24461 [Phaseolus coccineus]|uniref:Mitochondrial import receptor subunit TOM6-like protein n=1 Tax=Phaseolus coccineus TaxID=3886 RepID=A0AAN9LW18_PHACN
MGLSLGSVYPLSLCPRSAVGLQKQKNLEERGLNRETLIRRGERRLRVLGFKPDLIGEGIMFPGMFMRKPDKAAALKQLKSHVTMFGAWVLVIRVTPYVLHFLTAEKEELKLEL